MRLPSTPVLERIPFSGPASLAIREFKCPAFQDPWHQHREIELTWIIKGSGLRHVGDSVEPFYLGDFCLLGSSLPHTWLSQETAKDQAVHSLVVQFDPLQWGSTLLELPEFAKITGLFDRAARGLCFDLGMGERMRRKLNLRKTALYRFTAFLEVLEELAATPAARPLALVPWSHSKRMESDPRLRVVLAHLGKHIGEPVSQAQMAKLLRLSPASFSRFFRRAVGKTFGAYLTDLRLSEACRQLLETDRTISEIAFSAGFSNLSNFNRAFRLARGMPPREFRRQSHDTPQMGRCL